MYGATPKGISNARSETLDQKLSSHHAQKTARFNLSDFSFSFASNRDQLLEIRRRYGLDEKVGTKGKSK